MVSFVNRHKKLVIILLIVLVLIFLVKGFISFRNSGGNSDGSEDETVEDDGGSADDEDLLTTDSMIMQSQAELVSAYGKLPDGYLWDFDGQLLSQGDKSMSAEEVLYAYINGLKSLDLSSAQKFSRDSLVVETYESYFDSTDKVTDYYDQFIRDMYRRALLSLQIVGIEDTAVFVENKQVFTVKARMLDLTKKDFWYKDKTKIYEALELYGSTEDDSTRAEIYLYDYIRDYWSGDDVPMRDVTFDITVEKYPDLDTGWLVSIDTDIDNACKYSEGTIVVSFIQNEFAQNGVDYLNELRNGGNGEKTGKE